MRKTKQRLLQIKNSLTWQDYEMAELQLSLLAESQERSVVSIIKAIKNQSYKEALALIESILNESSTALVEYEDTELEDLRAQLKALEQMVVALSEQKTEQLSVLNEFNTKLSLATGNIVQQILELRKNIEQEKLRLKEEKLNAAKQAVEDEKAKLEKLKNQRKKLEEQLEASDEFELDYERIKEDLDSVNEAIREQHDKVREQHKTAKELESMLDDASEDAFSEAQQEYEQFEQSYEEAKENKVAQLDEEEASLLKKLYRKAARLCHPDTVTDDLKDQATEIMQQLNQAKDQGDIETVQSILEQLENGTAFIVASEQLTDRKQIESKIAELVSKLEEINQEIEAINQDETWLIIVSLDSWDDYFEEQKRELSAYLDQLKKEYQLLLNTESSIDMEDDSATSFKQPEKEMTTSKGFTEPKFEDRQEKTKANPTDDESYWRDEF